MVAITPCALPKRCQRHRCRPVRSHCGRRLRSFPARRARGDSPAHREGGGRAFTRIVDVRDAEGLQAAHDAGSRNSTRMAARWTSSWPTRHQPQHRRPIDTPADIWRERSTFKPDGVFSHAGGRQAWSPQAWRSYPDQLDMGMRTTAGCRLHRGKHGVSPDRTGARVLSYAGSGSIRSTGTSTPT